MNLAVGSLYKLSKLIYPHDLQYFYPLCWNVPVSCTAGFPQWLYMLKLRTSKSVHSTLRTFMQSIGLKLEEELQLQLDYDKTPNSWVNFNRGLQTITAPKSESQTGEL